MCNRICQVRRLHDSSKISICMSVEAHMGGGFPVGCWLEPPLLPTVPDPAAVPDGLWLVPGVQGTCPGFPGQCCFTIVCASSLPAKYSCRVVSGLQPTGGWDEHVEVTASHCLHQTAYRESNCSTVRSEFNYFIF